MIRTPSRCRRQGRESRPYRRLRRAGIAVAAGLVPVLLLVGCHGPVPPRPTGSAEAAASDRTGQVPSSPAVSAGATEGTAAPTPAAGASEPVTARSPAPAVTQVDAHLPLTWAHSVVTRPGWTELPRHLDGLFLGFAAPQDHRASLRFSAVDNRGTVLWHADRPATCTGYALSRADDRPVAVLTDLDAADRPMRTTASGYDLATGDRLWGPVPVPGSLQGPGLVFAAPAPPSAMGSAGPRVALDAATGRVVADERTDPAARIIGEYHGIVVTARRGQLRAVDAATGKQRWSIANPLGDRAAALSGVPAPDGTALIAAGPRDGATMIDLATGDVLARGVRDAAVDSLSGTYLVVEDATLTGFTATDEPWHRDVPPGSRIVAAGSGLVYLVSDGVGRVFNAVTGRAAAAYPPDVTHRFAVPQAISATGAAVFRIDGQVLLATVSAG